MQKALKMVKGGYRKAAYVAGAVALVPVCYAGPAFATVTANGSPMPDLSAIDADVTDISTLMSNTVKLGGGLLIGCIALGLSLWATRHLGNATKSGTR